MFPAARTHSARLQWRNAVLDLWNVDIVCLTVVEQLHVGHGTEDGVAALGAR